MINDKCRYFSYLLNSLKLGQESSNEYFGIQYHPVLPISKLLADFTYLRQSRV